tara:strand:+ start:1368 stop:2507 length:1140 start_codon:yes stop_codon:yes gene_type:complete
MGSITGLKDINATSVSNSGQFYLGDNLDAGVSGEALLSQGTQMPAAWGTPTGHLLNPLTAGTNITYSSGSATFDGSVADTINATDTNTQLNLTEGNGIEITNTGGLNRTIAVKPDEDTIDFDGDEIAVQKVPEDLTINGTTFNGSVARNFVLATSDTTYQGGDNITIDTTTAPDTIDLDKTLTDMTSIAFNNTGTPTYIIGSNYYMQPRTGCTYLDLKSTTNLILPPNVFEVSPGTFHMAFSQGIWMPNDDSSYFNYAIEDDFTAPLATGRGKILSSSLEVQGFLNIPNGWRATGIYVDVRGSTGFQVSRSITMYSVKTYSTSNPISSTYTYLGGSTTNNAYTLSSTMDGAIDRVMWIEVALTSTSDYIAGGYIVLTKL